MFNAPRFHIHLSFEAALLRCVYYVSQYVTIILYLIYCFCNFIDAKVFEGAKHLFASHRAVLVLLIFILVNADLKPDVNIPRTSLFLCIVIFSFSLWNSSPLYLCHFRSIFYSNQNVKCYLHVYVHIIIRIKQSFQMSSFFLLSVRP